MSYPVLTISYSIDPFFYCPCVNTRLKYHLHKQIKTYLICKINATTGLVYGLVQSFLQFFHFAHDSCQTHNGLIKSRPSWRQWASFGLMQALWFGLGLCGLWSAEPFISMCIPFICITNACTICIFEGRVNLHWSLLCLFFVFVVLAVRLQ